jgi:carbonyl reductase 1
MNIVVIIVLIFIVTIMSTSAVKIAVITGANQGIGLEISKKMASSGMKTILACRNEASGKGAAEKISAMGLDCEFRQLDISDKTSVNKFASALENDYGHIDVLVNNAGIAFKGSDPTPHRDQAYPTVHTNYHGTLLLTESLLPLLRKSSYKPRIVNVASMAGHLRILKSQQKKDQFTANDLTISQLTALMDAFVEDTKNEQPKDWPNSCYGTSKLGVVALTKVLARNEPSMLVTCCCPGYVQTNMSSFNGNKTPEEGARTPVFLAMTMVDAGPSGAFFMDEKEVQW